MVFVTTDCISAHTCGESHLPRGNVQDSVALVPSPLKMKPSLDLIWHVCARRCTFLPPLIASRAPLSPTTLATSEEPLLETRDSYDQDELG